MSEIRLLLVDDEESFRKLTARSLASAREADICRVCSAIRSLICALVCRTIV